VPEQGQYDIVIIGGGPGGYVAAIRAAQLGARVALVEKERIGGTCLNRGCIPTKALVRHAEIYQQSRRAGAFGVDITGEVGLNFARVMQRKTEVVNTFVQGIEELVRAYRIDLFDGVGTILQPGLVRVVKSPSFDSQEAGTKAGGWELSCRRIIIATGAVPARVPIPGTDLPGVLTSRELLEIDKLPRSMVIIGGSVVGIEFASIFNAFGTKVTVLGRRTFLKDAEERLTKRFRGMLRKQGVSINIGLSFKEIVLTDEGLLRVTYEQGGEDRYAEGEIVLLSTGRKPYTGGVGLENAGIALEGEAIKVNEHLETNVPGIYAIGDCIGGYLLAHVASYEGEVAAENALGHRRAVDYTVVPNCIFTMPEIADVGLTEKQCKEMGIDYVVSRFPFNINGRALAMGEPDGQIRLICEKREDGKGGRVLGMHIMGPHASDLIAEGALAIKLGATAQDIAETIHAHPTLPEVVMEVAKGQLDGAIHYRKG